VAVKKHSNFIDGKFTDTASGESIEVINPSTGDVIGEVTNSVAEDVDRAVEAAERAFADDWGETTPAERFEYLTKLADALEEHREELGDLEALNVGKPREAAAEEVDGAADCLRF